MLRTHQLVDDTGCLLNELPTEMMMMMMTTDRPNRPKYIMPAKLKSRPNQGSKLAAANVQNATDLRLFASKIFDL